MSSNEIIILAVLVLILILGILYGLVQFLRDPHPGSVLLVIAIGLAIIAGRHIPNSDGVTFAYGALVGFGPGAVLGIFSGVLLQRGMQ